MLTDRASDIVHAALRASIEGPLVPDWEFHILMGVQREEMRAVLDAWPTVVDADLAINNAFNTCAANPITSGRHGRNTATRIVVSSVAPSCAGGQSAG
jgi:hypothetical protein